jgi:hypothetical protein
VESSRYSVYLSTRLVAGGGAGVDETAVGCVGATDSDGCVDAGLLQLTSAASTSPTPPAMALIGIPSLAGLDSTTRGNITAEVATPPAARPASVTKRCQTYRRCAQTLAQPAIRGAAALYEVGAPLRVPEVSTANRRMDARLGHTDPAFTLATYAHLMPNSTARTKTVIEGVYERREGQNGPAAAQQDHNGA